MSGGGSNTSLVFYARSYHPIQSGSIDGTDILPHDNAVYRALLCSSAGLYDPFGDPKVIGDPYCTLFVGHLSRLTDEESLRKAMGKYGRVKTLRLVRHIVTGASCGYAFVEYETEREMRRAYEDAHHSFIDDSEIIVEYNRQQLMPGWIPRRLGGGLGGRKESGQLRFGGRDRPFRAPLYDGRPIPWDDLNRLGIPPPPEGHYVRRNQIPSPPRRRRPDVEEDLPSKRTRTEHMKEVSPRKKRRSSYEEEPLSRKRKGSTDRDATSSRHQRHQSEHSGNDGSRKHRRRQSEHSGDDGSRRHRRHHSGHSGDDSFSKHHRHQSEHSGDDRTSRHHRHQTHHADQSKITTVSREGS